MKSIVEEVEEARDFNEVFRVVKRVVEERLGLRRAGLMLVIADAPPGVLAYHEVGSNAIVLNRRHLEQWLVGRSRSEANSYVFVLLLHEYLHSLGILEESEVRRLVKEVVGELFGRGHTATRIAEGDEEFRRRFSQEVYLGRPRSPLIVRGFDDDNLRYIG